MVQDRSQSQTDFTTYDEILRKSLHAGTKFALRYNLQMDEDKLRCWQASFLSQFDPNEQFIVKRFVFLWREDDYENQHAPLAGFPSSTEEIRWLFIDGRLDASCFTPALTDEEMDIIHSRRGVLESKVNSTQVELSKSAEQESQNCSTCGGSCGNDCTTHRHLCNKVIQYITGGLYKSTTKAFTDAPKIRRTLLKFINSMRRYMLPVLISEFDCGGFRNFDDIMNTVRRCFKIDEERRTMAGLFRHIQNIARKEMTTEGKMLCMKNVVRKIAIKKEKDFIKAIDRPYQTPEAMKPEQYSPLVNTLLTYIIMRENVPAAKWEDIQSSFEAKIQNGWSYRSWHENRPELYRIMDGYSQNVSPDTSVSESEVVQPVKSPDENQNQPQDPNSKIYLAEVNYTPKEKQDKSSLHNPFERHAHREEADEYVECTSCSQYASSTSLLTIYHPKYAGNEGFGACCIYDCDGTEKELEDGSKWISHLHFVPLPMKGWGAVLADKRTRTNMPQVMANTSFVKMPQAKLGEFESDDVKPEIQVDFGTRVNVKSTPGISILDSAAPFSMVHESCLHNCSFRPKDHVPEDLLIASGGVKRLRPRMISMKVKIDGVGECKLENVLVNKSRMPRASESKLVIGQHDLRALGAKIDFGRKTMEFSNASGRIRPSSFASGSISYTDNQIRQIRFRPYDKVKTTAGGEVFESKFQKFRRASTPKLSYIR